MPCLDYPIPTLPTLFSPFAFANLLRYRVKTSSNYGKEVKNVYLV